jgi:hypothetical protein
MMTQPCLYSHSECAFSVLDWLVLGQSSANSSWAVPLLARALSFTNRFI